MTRDPGRRSDNPVGLQAGRDSVASTPRRVHILSAVLIPVAVALAVAGLFLPVEHPADLPLSPELRLALAGAVMAAAQLARLRLRVGSGTINVAWGEAALIVGLYLVPPGWLPAAVFVGTGVAVLLISLFSDRRTATEIAHVASSLTIATAVAAAVTLAVHPVYAQPLGPGLALALVAGCLAYLAVTTLLVALTLSLRHGLPFHTLVLRTVQGKLVMVVGNAVVGLAVIGFLEHDPRWLLLLPPALWLLQQTYAHRLRAGDERRAWQALAEATGALNQLDERGVARAGVRGALALFGAERVEVDVIRPDGIRRRYGGWCARETPVPDAGDVSEMDVLEPAPPAAGDGAVPVDPPGLAELELPHVVGNGGTNRGNGYGVARAGPLATRPLLVGGVQIGELRVHYPPSVSPPARERMALQTFGDALGAALHDAATHHRLRLLEDRSMYDAVHDPLTGLLNRAALLARGDARLRLLESERPVALLLLDINHFKEVNDTLGHAAGDDLLQVTADRLAELTQPGDLLARLGGDEFAVLVAPGDAARPADGEPAAEDETAESAAAGSAAVDGLMDGSDRAGASGAMTAALRRARQISDRLAVPTEVAGVRLVVEASVGVVVASAGAADMTELLRRADIAMYQAKEGGGSVAWYDSARDAASTDRLALLAELREALSADDQLVLALQPAVDLTTGEPTGVEALVRWRHPRRGALGPGEFVRAVEGSELVSAFTRYVIDKALAAAADWARQGVPVPISVNVSARSLLDPRLPADVAELLRHHQVPPQRLVLEITETVVLSEMEVIDEVLAGLRSSGVQLAVDDFGTGFSSLTFLTRVSVDELKVDQAFVAKMVDSPEAAAIVRTTIELGRELGLRVVAEGVETADQRAALVALGCNAAQGYHFFRPMPADKVVTVLRSLLQGAAQARILPLRADGAS
jgi:predicted signal transduction protein with EAL and GGDEF domain